ncbi:MAG: hypothetical protein P4L74_06080 [Candidatus Doudnabacteria bacterium]|nr:hypothetical protein [Candidatus Doudnabacteria bacterium]
MLDTPEQKQVFAGSIVLIIILGVISIWQHPNVTPVGPDYAALQQQNQQEQAANNAYLASLGTTAQAQQQIFSQILPPDQLQAAVDQALNSSQTITIPVVADSQIKISKTTGKQALQDYFNQSGPIFDQLASLTDASQNDLYSQTGNQDNIKGLAQSISSDETALAQLAVPQEAVDFHKQLLVGLRVYGDLVSGSQNYMTGQDQNPWPDVYKNYVIIGNVLAQGNTDYNQLNQKYKFTASSGQTGLASGNWLAPKASAQLATIDVWAKAQQILEEAAASAISQFMLSFLSKLADKIEASYRISNFLYYSDALVSGQYVDDYLNKYVTDPVDRTIAKNFIPEITCGNTQNLNTTFNAKADQYLGFDPATLDPNDPNYYQKLNRVGNFMATPQGWQEYYLGIAQQAQSNAQSAANNEINSPGLKAGRDAQGSGILTPGATSEDVLRGIFMRFMQEGSSVSTFASTEKITAQIATTFLNNFVLKGVTLLEQKTCITVPQLQLVTQVP